MAKALRIINDNTPTPAMMAIRATVLAAIAGLVGEGLDGISGAVIAQKASPAPIDLDRIAVLCHLSPVRIDVSRYEKRDLRPDGMAAAGFDWDIRQGPSLVIVTMDEDDDRLPLLLAILDASARRAKATVRVLLVTRGSVTVAASAIARAFDVEIDAVPAIHG